MYSALLLQDRFQGFADWVNKSREDERPALEEFLFRATSSTLALSEMKFREQQCLAQFRQFKSQLTLRRPRIVFSSLDLFQLFQQFSPFMSSIRILQNMLLRIVGRRLQLRASIPKSLNDAARRLDQYGLPAEVVNLVSRYWSTGGNKLKGYRDLDQHYFTLCRHSFLEWEPSERIVVLLPDNPEEQAEASLTFADDLDAIRYFESSFNSFHSLVEAVCGCLAFGPAILKEELIVRHFGRLDDGVRQTVALWIDDAQRTRAIEIGQEEDRRLFLCNRIAHSTSA